MFRTPPGVLEALLLEEDVRDIEAYLVLKAADGAWERLDDEGKQRVVFATRKLYAMETGDTTYPRNDEERSDLLHRAKMSALRAEGGPEKDRKLLEALLKSRYESTDQSEA